MIGKIKLYLFVFIAYLNFSLLAEKDKLERKIAISGDKKDD